MRGKGANRKRVFCTGRRRLGWGFFDRPDGKFSTGVDKHDDQLGEFLHLYGELNAADCEIVKALVRLKGRSSLTQDATVVVSRLVR
jgi:hypothetical protein